MSAIPSILSSFLSERDLKIVKLLPAGHTGTLLLLAQNRDAGQCVLKFGNSPSQIEEILANETGYKRISQLGAKLLLPEPISLHVCDDDNLVLEMAFAGEQTWTARARHRCSPLRDAQALVGTWNRLIEATVHTYKDQHDPLHEALTRFWLPFQRRTDTAKHLLAQACWQARCQHVALTIMDFTPDNVFFEDERVTFIDPWRQASYLGNPLVSFGQFLTLCQLYELPFVELAQCLMETLPAWEAHLGASRVNLRAGQDMGAALQYALSSFVRRESDRECSRFLLAKSTDLITITARL